MSWFVHIFVPSFSTSCPFFHVNMVVLINEQTQILTEATAKFLKNSSPRSDDNLTGKKGVLGTCLESTFA